MIYNRKIISKGNIFAFIIAGIFITWSIFAFMGMLWNFGTNWVGFIWLGLGFMILLGQIGSISIKYNQNYEIRKIILWELQHDSNVSLEDVARNTGIPLKDVKDITLILRIKRFLSESYIAKTRTSSDQLNVERTSAVPVTIVQSASSLPTALPARTIAHPPQELPKHCPNCGTATDKDTTYCPYCGHAF